MTSETTTTQPEQAAQPEACVPNEQASFYGLGLAPKLLEAVERLGFKVPTPIQHKAIPVAIEGKDIIGVAQTGTGKTIAFGLPMIQRLARVKGKGLVVLPTRELAEQVERALSAVGRDTKLRTAVLIGGASMRPQLNALAAKPHIVIGTPGRIIDHLEQRTLDLSDVTILVLDEADRMLDMGFLPQIRRILRTVPKDRQTLLFSATMPNDIVNIAGQHMRLPVRVEVAPSGTLAERVEHELFVVKREQKLRLLEKLLGEYRGTVLVFTRTKFGARKICRILQRLRIDAAEIHSDRSQAQRREALDGFKSGRYRVLIATDIASRGIDVNGIELVINFDVPEQADDYVHRVGRTGRAGQAGKAITFALPDQGEEVREIEKIAQLYLPTSQLPELPPEKFGRRDDRRPPFGVRPAAPVQAAAAPIEPVAPEAIIDENLDEPEDKPAEGETVEEEEIDEIARVPRPAMPSLGIEGLEFLPDVSDQPTSGHRHANPRKNLVIPEMGIGFFEGGTKPPVKIDDRRGGSPNGQRGGGQPSGNGQRRDFGRGGGHPGRNRHGRRGRR